MSSLKTLAKVKADQLSPKLRERLGFDRGEELTFKVESSREKNNPWPSMKGSLTPIEAEALRSFIASSRRSRKATLRV